MSPRQAVSIFMMVVRRLYWFLDPRKKVTGLYDRTSARSLSLKPFGRRTIILENMPAGETSVRLTHSDSYLHSLRKGLFVTVRAPGVTGQELVEQSPMLAFSPNVGAFAYLGGGRKRSSLVQRNVEFSLPTPKGFVRLDIISQMDRYLNLDEVRFQVVKDNKFGQAFIDELVTTLAEERLDLEPCTSIVYADIDLNVVDGSSVWVSSMLSILAANEPCIFVSKQDIVSDVIVSNISGLENVRIVTPADYGMAGKVLSMENAVAIVEGLDRRLPGVRRIYVRGLPAARQLVATRQFFDRLCVYLTDFYVVREGVREVPNERAESLKVVGRHARHLLTQTSAIEEELTSLIGVERPFTLLPPPIPVMDGLVGAKSTVPFRERPVLRIGYAGKVVPDWGIAELFDWASALRASGMDVEVTIVANKISGGSLQGPERAEFIRGMRNRIAIEAAHHFEDMNREQAMRTMAGMDLVWCYRPAALEENTLELSTKLLEMVSLGAACVCYPNKQNVAALGEDYPFYVADYEDLERILSGDALGTPQTIIDQVADNHSLAVLSERIKTQVQGAAGPVAYPRIGVAVHDPKFVDAFLSQLKSKGYPVRQDFWEWGDAQNLARSATMLEWADVIFCEWGLANAVWYAEHNAAKKPLYIRMHLQEIKERARRFGEALEIDNVTKVIFVSENVRQQAVEMFGWDAEKTTVIPNYVLGEEYLPLNKPRASDEVAFGMVGIIPQRKRFDRAVDLLERAVEEGLNAHLYIKGPRPESLDFMRAPGRADELVFYNEQYARFENDPVLKDRIHFDAWDNDVAIWYEKIDFILSCSDFESFHYALADGVLAGCSPLVWPWDEAETLYAPSWLVDDVEAAWERVRSELSLPEEARTATIDANRSLVLSRYGSERVFDALEAQLTESVKHSPAKPREAV